MTFNPWFWRVLAAMMRAMSNVASQIIADDQTTALAKENVQLKATVVHLETLVDKLKHQLAQLNRRQFGVSAEGLLQLGLWPTSALPENAPPMPSTSIPAHERQKPTRKSLPADLPRKVIEIDLPDDKKPCPGCQGARHVIGEEVSEKLDIIPAQMTVLEYRRKKYACRCCEGNLATAPMPAQIIEQGMATAGLLAHVAVAKFCDHQPLARQEKFFDRHDIKLPRSTLTDWMLSIGFSVSPLVDRIVELLKMNDYLGNDDTPLPWQNGRKGKTTTARLWVWRGFVDDKPLFVYQFTTDRSGEHPADFLKGWQGFLQVDAYSAYDRLFGDGKIIEVGCMAHARRRFFEIAKTAKKPGFAHEIVEQFGELYAIEREAKAAKLAPTERKALRHERAPPILEKLKSKLEAHLPQLPPKGPLAKAIGYMLRHWIALNRYLDDGRLEIDNNGVERAIRPVALGRVNWLFIASERGGHATAALYSLIQSAKANGLNPYAYLRDVLTRLPTTKAKDIDSLLPHLWKPTE